MFSLPRPRLPFRRHDQRRPKVRTTPSRAPARELRLGRVERPEPPRPIPWRGILRTVVSAAAVSGIAYGAFWLYSGDTLRVDTFAVNGVQVTNAEAIVAAAGLHGESMLSVDLAAAERRIGEVPGVRRVTLSRDWPRGVVIDVVEHQAWGYWQVAGQRVQIDVEGEVLDVARPPGDGAPTIFAVAEAHTVAGGIVAQPDAVKLVDRLLSDGTLRRLGVSPKNFIYRMDRGLTLQTEDGPDAIFGDSRNYEFKVAAWGALLDRLESDADQEVTEIDLRFGRNVVLR